MKPHLRSDGSKQGNKLLLDMLESGGASGMLEAMQTQLTESRQKAAQIEQKAEQTAKNVTLKAHSEAAAIRAQATREATDIKAEAKLALREVQKVRSEVEGLQSTLNYQRTQFNDKKAEFKLAIAGVFERHLEG